MFFGMLFEHLPATTPRPHHNMLGAPAHVKAGALRISAGMLAQRDVTGNAAGTAMAQDGIGGIGRFS